MVGTSQETKTMTTDLFMCPSCTRSYTSQLAALDCEDQDRYEDDDRRNGRFFGIHRGTD